MFPYSYELDISKFVIYHTRNMYLFVTISFFHFFYAAECYAINDGRFFFLNSFLYSINFLCVQQKLNNICERGNVSVFSFP